MKETRKKSFCPECGSPLEPGDLECPACGIAVGKKTGEENYSAVPRPRPRKDLVEEDEEEEEIPRGAGPFANRTRSRRPIFSFQPMSAVGPYYPVTLAWSDSAYRLQVFSSPFQDLFAESWPSAG
jgi:hypothetical protein